MYVKDEIKNKLGVTDETSMSDKISLGAKKHYILTLKKPEVLNHFNVDVDIFKDNTLRLYYNGKEGTWIIPETNELKNTKGEVQENNNRPITNMFVKSTIHWR